MIGQAVSHYKILEKLGEGGMGVVYKAEDMKLKRIVALKFLPDRLSASEQDKARFIQEAQSAAALNHPNICTIHGIDEHEGHMFISMEFVDGQTLRERRGSISMKQAIDLGIQIADGLAAAHEKGIVHRDIKPENIMIRKDGIAQIMDFGLAKIRNASSQINRLTKEGSTVGTAGYMSPEQVQGLEADHRSDIFSFGVLLFEMFTGQLPFKGVHETALAYEIVNVDAPPMSSVKPEIDPTLDAVILECLEKDPNERTQSAKQISVDLKRYRRESSRQRASRITSVRPVAQVPQPQQLEHAPHVPPGRSSRLPWAIAAVCCFGVVVFALLYFRNPASPLHTVRSSLLPPDQFTFAKASAGAGKGHLALSPDGSMLAFVATDSSGKTHLMVRSLNAYAVRELSSTQGAYYPFWSPDNRFVGFFQNGKMKKIDASGGPSITICDAQDARGGTWNQAGVIVFAPNSLGPLFEVRADGGTPAQLTALDTTLHQRTHRWPSFLPDGNHVLYFGRSSFGGVEREEDGVYIASLDSKESRRLPVAKSNAVYASGYLLYLQDKALMAQRFDPGSLELKGEATPIAEPVEFDLDYNRAVFTASENGVIAFEPSGGPSSLQLEWIDRSGASRGTVGAKGDYGYASISPGGKTLAFDLYDPQSKNRDIWLYDLSRNIKTRFTFDPNVDALPVWSPDGSRIIFQSDRKGHYDLFEKPTSGTATEELILESSLQKFPNSCSSDGRFLAYNTFDTRGSGDIWIMPFGITGRSPFLLLGMPPNEDNAVFSPDMRWVAYLSDESGAFELYATPFHDSSAAAGTVSGKWQISANGINPNTFPRWSRDGRQLYYQSADNRIMSVAIDAQGSQFSAGTPSQLFEIHSKGGGLFQDVTPDGQLFLFVNNVGGVAASPVSLITNWDAELKGK